jgi:hypothetical protein
MTNINIHIDQYSDQISNRYHLSRDFLLSKIDLVKKQKLLHLITFIKIIFMRTSLYPNSYGSNISAIDSLYRPHTPSSHSTSHTPPEEYRHPQEPSPFSLLHSRHGYDGLNPNQYFSTRPPIDYSQRSLASSMISVPMSLRQMAEYDSISEWDLPGRGGQRHKQLDPNSLLRGSQMADILSGNRHEMESNDQGSFNLRKRFSQKHEKEFDSVNILLGGGTGAHQERVSKIRDAIELHSGIPKVNIQARQTIRGESTPYNILTLEPYPVSSIHTKVKSSTFSRTKRVNPLHAVYRSHMDNALNEIVDSSHSSNTNDNMPSRSCGRQMPKTDSSQIKNLLSWE